MQEERLRLRGLRVGALPILNRFIERMGLEEKTPTIEQVLRLFENQNKHALYDGDRLIRQFADPLTPVQSQILQLLSIPTAGYAPGK
jgi:hypothetical protein